MNADEAKKLADRFVVAGSKGSKWSYKDSLQLRRINFAIKRSCQYGLRCCTLHIKLRPLVEKRLREEGFRVNFFITGEFPEVNITWFDN